MSDRGERGTAQTIPLLGHLLLRSPHSEEEAATRAELPRKTVPLGCIRRAGARVIRLACRRSVRVREGTGVGRRQIEQIAFRTHP